MICICLLPGANQKLPGTTYPMIILTCSAAFGCWVAGRVLERKGPKAHEKACWWLAALICSYGWVMTFFPSAMVERLTGVIIELDQNPFFSFGTIDQAASVQGMISMSNALMLLMMALDFGEDRRFRVVLAMSVTAAGFITAATGLCLHSHAELASLWKVQHVPSSVFGFFWYHGNAASFLNLSWPAGMWLCFLLLRNGLRHFRQQMMLSVLVVMIMVQIIGVCVNVSKMGHLLMVLEMAMLVGVWVLVWKPDLSMLPFGRWRLAALISIGVVLLGAAAWLTGAGAGLERWNVFAGRHFDDPARRHAALMALRIGLDYGDTGTGPGTFEWISAHYAALDPVLMLGRWRHAHNDYAEFFAEWGWPGGCIFCLLLLFPGRRWFSALKHVLGSGLDLQEISFHRLTGLIFFSAAVISVLIHALVDFPLQIDSIRHLFATAVGMVLAMTSSSSRGTAKGSTTRKSEESEWNAPAQGASDSLRVDLKHF